MGILVLGSPLFPWLGAAFVAMKEVPKHIQVPWVGKAQTF